MAGGSQSLSVKLIATANNLLVARLSVGLDVLLEVGFNPNFRQSFISPHARDDLAGRGLIEMGAGRTYLLKNVVLGGAPIPNLRVRASAIATRFGVDGIIAADFLGQYSRWYVDREARLLVLSA